MKTISALVISMISGIFSLSLCGVADKIIDANNRFAFKIYSEAVRQNEGKNVFISPLSISQALEMTYNGAAGITAKEMVSVLELTGMSLDEINSANMMLMEEFNTDTSKFKWIIANSLWGKKGIDFKPDFLKRNKEFYKAEVKTLNFSNPSSVGIINKWVEEKTYGKIRKIVDNIDESKILYLINAIYFKAAWTFPFMESATDDRTFYFENGGTKQVKMMHGLEHQYSYYRDSDFEAIRLQYDGCGFSMYVFLPAKDVGLSKFLSLVTAENMTIWRNRLKSQKGLISLPRFKFEFEMNLVEPLKKMGMQSAFDPNSADFSEMTEIDPSRRVFISEAKHKTFIVVNEEGTEAAAVTSIGFSQEMYIPPTFHMRVDRPFFFTIIDDASGAIIFMGSIFEPVE